MAPMPTASHLRARGLLVGLLLVAGCGGGQDAGAVREVLVDGGTEALVATGDVRVRARPGDVVRITSANRGAEGLAPEGEPAGEEGHGDHGSTVVHAFVAAPPDGDPDDLPPLFVEAQGGAGPNAGVWGACRGGDAAEAVGTCPVAPIDGPQGWDGRGYWSTGAMLPGEHRDIPLAADVAPGTLRLLCSLHPELAVEVVVTDDPGSPPEPVEAPTPQPPDEVEPADPERGLVVVAPATEDTTVLAFSPATVEVQVGEEVRWVTTTRAPHDLTFGAEEAPDLQHTDPTDALPDLPDGPWDGRGTVRSGYLSTDPSAPGGTTASLTFGAPGTYDYVCRFHPAMTGTVVVG
jgi:plastocyanin